MTNHGKFAADGESRKGRVFGKLLERTRSMIDALCAEKGLAGVTAGDLANDLGLLRNNVSMELNALVRDGKALKISGKPVLYLALEIMEQSFQTKFQTTYVDYSDFIDTLQSKTSDSKNSTKIEEPTRRIDEFSAAPRSRATGIFESIIGFDEDLQLQTKQAKAAILYPPNGLHTLLIGPTGSGKTTFAGVMHRFAVESGKLPGNAPYVIFNCADYAENAQLLISHLFGHMKGAYTGAEKEKKGLVDQADGGILFLDEIHRLPSEGQEMLFSLIDRGTYRRLGESDSTRTANILIIAATTENPQAAILSTFLRRIPLIIALPGLGERPLKVRMLLICRFFREESMKIKVPLSVSKEVLKVLLLYQCPGNIGQLRNDIQLLCANAFIEYITRGSEDVQIKLSQLTDRLREGYFSIDEKRQEIMQNFNLNDCESIRFSGDENELDDNLREVMLYDEYQIGEDFYSFILENAQKLYKEGRSVSEIMEHIGEEMQSRLRQDVPKFNGHRLQVDQEVLSKIATPEIVRIIETHLRATPLFGPVIDTKIVYSLALHMETMIERLKQGEITIYPDIAAASAKYPQEYDTARRMKSDVEKILSIKIPEDETAFIATFLHSIAAREGGAIQVLVMAHGHSTASNMVEVAKVLMDYDCLHALDMPMESKVEDTLNRAVELVKQIDQGGGVLLLVDMGSLTTFSEIITERTGIPTKTVRMVSTPMVIEAARKAMMPDMTLEELEQSVITMSSFIGERVKIDPAQPTSAVRSPEQQTPSQVFSHGLLTMLENILVFLNIKKAYKILNEILNNIAKGCSQQVDDVIRLKFLFHCSCMIERMIRKEPLPYKRFAKVKRERTELFRLVKHKFELAEEVFAIAIPDSEIAYIVEMLFLHFSQQPPQDGILVAAAE